MVCFEFQRSSREVKCNVTFSSTKLYMTSLYFNESHSAPTKHCFCFVVSIFVFIIAYSHLSVRLNHCLSLRQNHCLSLRQHHCLSLRKKVFPFITKKPTTFKYEKSHYLSLRGKPLPFITRKTTTFHYEKNHYLSVRQRLVESR